MPRKKPTISVTIDDELLDWVDSKIEDRTFSSRSHAMEQALFRLKEGTK